jgi:AcrR family transcriptional regulator
MMGKMGRRSEHSADSLRLLILEASEKIISTTGLSGLSAREVARSVGYSPGTIYNIFENLDDLILQVEGRMLDELDARLAALSTDKSADQRVLELAHAYLAFTTERPRPWNHAVRASPATDDAGACLVSAQARRIDAAVEGSLQPLVSGPTTPPWSGPPAYCGQGARHHFTRHRRQARHRWPRRRRSRWSTIWCAITCLDWSGGAQGRMLSRVHLPGSILLGSRRWYRAGGDARRCEWRWQRSSAD